MTGEPETRPAKHCPICGDPAVARYLPFCSARCKDIDLGRWLKGSYRIPAAPVDEEQDDARKDHPEDEGDA